MKPKKKRIALFEEPEDSSLRKGPETPSLDTLPPIQPSSSHNTANGKQTLSAMPLVKQDPAEHLSLARGAVSGLTKVIKRAKNRQDAAADGAVQKAKSKSKKKDGLTIKGIRMLCVQIHLLIQAKVCLKDPWTSSIRLPNHC